MLIRALPAIARNCPSVLYAIAGEGWERPYLEEAAAQTGVSHLVEFIGAPGDHELLACYQQCDLFALPTLPGRLGRRGVRDRLSGGPGERQTGCRWGVRRAASKTLISGRTGEIVPCEQPEPLATIVTALLCDPERLATMGARLAAGW